MLFVLGAMGVGTYFLLLTAPSLEAYFTPDDTMNLYRSWSFPWHLLVKANLLFFQTSPFYRPMGSVWYRMIFAWAGFNPLPFHIVYLCILSANIFLTYSVSRLLTGSREIAALCALIGCYHPWLANLYFDTGFVYDVLCYLFYLSALLVYLRARQHGRPLLLRFLTACSLLYICALNSKEMAVTLPVVLAIYELLYHGPHSWSRRDLLAWVLREGRGPVTLGFLTVPFVIAHLRGSESLIADPVYRPILTWARFMETSRGFLDGLVYHDKWFSSAGVLVLWLAMLAFACIMKSKPMQFAWLFFMLTVAPVAFLFPRGGPQYYIPWFGWVLYAAAAVVTLAGRLLPNPAPGIRFWPSRARGIGLFIAATVVLFPVYRAVGWSSVTSVTDEAPVIHSISDQLHHLYPSAPPGTRFLFLDDPYERGWENLIFIVRLTYRQDSVVVDRVKKMDRPPTAQEMATYDHVIDYQGGPSGGRFLELTRPWQRSNAPMIRFDGDRPAVYHLDWTPVTEQLPGKPGEVLISSVIHLGATEPPIPPGEAFPAGSLLPVVSPVEVEVNGQQAKVPLKIGWPGMIGTYRVDFRIPDDTHSGVAKVVLTAGGITGPETPIPVGK